MKTTTTKTYEGNGLPTVSTDGIKNTERTFTASEVRTILDEVLKECEESQAQNFNPATGYYISIKMSKARSIISSKKEQVSK